MDDYIKEIGNSLDFTSNLINEFESYKIVYNQNIIDEKQSIINQNQELLQEIERLKEEKEKIYNSNSWKITKPIRWLGRNVKKGKN